MNRSERSTAAHIPASSVALFYVAMAALAYLWSWLSGSESGLVLFDPSRLPEDIALGVGAGLLVVVASRLLRRVSPAARALERELHTSIGVLNWRQVTVFALTSSLGEELLFRGAMQESFGLVITSLLFGALHGGFIGRWRLWSVFAVLLGFLMGWQMDETGALLAPILTHFTVNLFNLAALNKLADKGAN